MITCILTRSYADACVGLADDDDDEPTPSKKTAKTNSKAKASKDGDGEDGAADGVKEESFF